MFFFWKECDGYRDMCQTNTPLCGTDHQRAHLQLHWHSFFFSSSSFACLTDKMLFIYLFIYLFIQIRLRNPETSWSWLSPASSLEAGLWSLALSRAHAKLAKEMDASDKDARTRSLPRSHKAAGVILMRFKEKTKARILHILLSSIDTRQVKTPWVEHICRPRRDR